MIYTYQKAKTYHFYLAVAYVFLVPFFLGTAKIVAGLMVLNWLLSGTFFKKYKQLLQPIPLLFIGFYMVNVFGLLYSEDLRQGLAKIETKLLLLVFPLLLFTFGRFTKQQIKTILISFVTGIFTASLIFFFHDVWFYSSITVALKKSYHWTHIMGYHRAFTALQMAMSFFIVLFYLQKTYFEMQLWQKTITLTYLVYSFVYVFLLSSRIEIIALVVVLLAVILIHFYQQNKLLRGMGYSLLTLIFIGLVGFSVPGVKMRFSQTIGAILHPQNEKQHRTAGDIRPRIWKSAFEIIKENPILGGGTGDVQIELNDKYIKNQEYVALKNNLTVHNQFIQMAVSLGLIGLLALLGILLVPFFLAMRKRDYLYLIFLSLFIIANMTESMLEKQEGVLFFAFFNSFFALNILEDTSPEEKLTTNSINHKQ